MTHHESARVRRGLEPFVHLLLVVACLGLLASCGGSGSDGSADTSSGAQSTMRQMSVASGGAVPAGWVGRLPAGQTSLAGTDGVPLHRDVTRSEKFKGIDVAWREVILIRKDTIQEDVFKEKIYGLGFKIAGRVGKSYQIDVSSSGDPLYLLIEKIKLLNVSNSVLPNYIGKPNYAVLDEYSAGSSGWSLEESGVKSAWSLMEKELLHGVSIGIIDGGFRFDHEDLKFTEIASGSIRAKSGLLTNNCAGGTGEYASIEPNLCKNENHGMFVSGIIGSTHNTKGVAGVASLAPTSLYGFRTDFTLQSTIAGIRYLVDSGVKIINMSLGLSICPEDSSKDCSYHDAEGNNISLKDAEQEIVDYYAEALASILTGDEDVLFVQSAGNDGERKFEDKSPVRSNHNGYFCSLLSGTFNVSPQYIDFIKKIRSKTLIVGASLKGRDFALYSSAPASDHDVPYIVAPGGESGGPYYTYQLGSKITYGIIGPAFFSKSLVSSGRYISGGGTSMAAPHVAGTAALMLSVNEKLKMNEISEIILENSSNSLNLPYGGATKGNGYRYLNAEAAVKEALARKNRVTLFSDDFNGSTLDSSKWTSTPCNAAFGDPTVQNGLIHLARCQTADTRGKVTVSGNKIVIEARFSGQAGGRDSNIALVDPETGGFLQIGDTNYSDGNGSGVYAYLYNGSSWEFAHRYGGSTSAFKEYRITIEGKNVTIERGDSLANLTEKIPVTLPRIVTGGTYYIRVGTGGGDGVYSPADFDWIRVTTY